MKGIFKKEGYMAIDEEEKIEINYFEGIYSEQALFLFSKDNWFRRLCYLVMINPWWERVVMALIILSSAKLAVDTYLIDYEDNSPFVIVSGELDVFFTWAFIVEAAVKIISLGFAMDEGSYVRDSWNQLDGFIVASTILEMMLGDAELDFIKILRMLRVLRPLRMISRNPELKQVIVALGESIG